MENKKVTRQAKYNYQCDECEKKDLVCPECGKRVKQGTPFSKWLRQLGTERPDFSSKNLAIHNLDFIWYWYKNGWFITVEEKQYGGKSASSQKDTHAVVSQMLTAASGSEFLTENAKRRVRGSSKELLEYRGHFVIRFENTTPDNSKWVQINTHWYKDENVRCAVIYLLKNGKMP